MSKVLNYTSYPSIATRGQPDRSSVLLGFYIYAPGMELLVVPAARVHLSLVDDLAGASVEQVAERVGELVVEDVD